MLDNTRRCRERLLETAETLDASLHTMQQAREKYGAIVDRNIVCHDALTYHYRFDGTNDLSFGQKPYDSSKNDNANKFFGEE